MHRRESSSSTVRARDDTTRDGSSKNAIPLSVLPIKASLWLHDDLVPVEQIVINPSILEGVSIEEGDLIEIAPYAESVNVHDFAVSSVDVEDGTDASVSDLDLDDGSQSPDSRCLCIVKIASNETLDRYPGMELLLHRSLANAFGFRPRTQVCLLLTDFARWRASHVELVFRDAYIARSDMWRMVREEIVGKPLFKGQKFLFLGTLKVTVQSIHVRGRAVSTGYFSTTTIPVFRSEAARYVLFIQMSREMWDFDSEGNGEIMFNKVINGFLPDLFRRWVQIEARHMVSIILFGRLEYDRYDFGDTVPLGSALSRSSSASNSNLIGDNSYQDFYRVVVTDMASAQWTVILNELKKDFRIFLRDMSLYAPGLPSASTPANPQTTRITGRPSAALKGNILEAINMASSQFANDYLDRDLIRTGISTVIITAGTGVFDVDRELLNLTSENLTNNGIGIDIICLSRMPLHSVPLFRYRLPHSNKPSRVPSEVSASPRGQTTGVQQPSLHSVAHSPAYSSFTSASHNYFSRFPSAFPARLGQDYGYGIPQWIDLSYWSPDKDKISTESSKSQHRSARRYKKAYYRSKHSFVPRVRMYELQMMGLMELGMADISIPYLNEAGLHAHKRRKRLHSDLAQLSANRSLSASPTFSRKGKPTILRHAENAGLIAVQAKSLSNTYDDMDKYDENIFRSVTKSNPKTKAKRPKQRDQDMTPTTVSRNAELSFDTPNTNKRASKTEPLSVLDTTQPLLRKTPELPKAEVSPSKPAKPTRISRTISYALRGLAPPMRTAAIAEVSVENIKAAPLLAKTSPAQAAVTKPSDRPGSVRSNDTGRESQFGRDVDSHSVLSSETAPEKPSRPISIGASGQKAASHMKTNRSHRLSHVLSHENTKASGSRKNSLNDSFLSSEEDPISEIQSLDYMPDSIPKSTVPFVRNVNASNPLKKHPKAASAFGKWQHLYPHKPRSSAVKWRSLCTPASVPLTTEDFPTAKELESGYDRRQHIVSLKNLDTSFENLPNMDILLREMIGLRLAHGYQVVTGDQVSRVAGEDLCHDEAFLEPSFTNQKGNCIFMVMGSTIQKIMFSKDGVVEVTKYVKKIHVQDFAPMQTYHYAPNIRTILAKEYVPRPIELIGTSKEYPWESADTYLALRGAGQDNKVHELRFWRARFVLLPVEPPANVYRAQQHSEDNEEEIHLLGIRALTQMWQKVRVFSQHERSNTQGRLGTVRRKDQNPLEVKFETLNPSEVVATELDKLLALEEQGEMPSIQLLPDSEKLDRQTSMVKLAQAMQGEKGIEIKSRRWHLRLHYNCFNGEEFTNWLLHNVKNIETRDEAVEFGNELMKEGLFEHVNGRHNFKDGNYFYSMKSDFRNPRADLKGSWFAAGRRSDRSIPPTPVSEHPNRDLAAPGLITRSRSGSSLAFQLNSSSPMELSKQLHERKKKTVCLSKMIKIDVDPRKRSSKPEIINLHYDRLHNPENCYHIELNWLNVTSKLVDDALVSWTTQAEKYGLKLVEVPIAEACEVRQNEPFRNPYRVKLALEPPKRPVVHNIFTTTSFTPQQNPSPDPHIYHKAILKRFNFVLDLEAASEYPENVDIEYSWGPLKYQCTQFVHRTGLGLAQITKEGDFLLLANRLYNSRFVNAKDAAVKFAPTDSGRPALGTNNHGQSTHSVIPQAIPGGIMGISARSPALSPFSPTIRASADVLGSRPAISASTLSQYITPEQVKDEFESFCSNPVKLEQFYKEVVLAPSVPPAPPSSSGPLSVTTSTSAEPKSRRTGGGSTSSSLLKPIREPTGGVTDFEVPAFELPESVASPASSGAGLGLGFGMLKRARGSVMYDSVAEMFGGKDKNKDKDNGHNGGSLRQEDSTNTGRSSRAASGSVRNSPAVGPYRGPTTISGGGSNNGGNSGSGGQPPQDRRRSSGQASGPLELGTGISGSHAMATSMAAVAAAEPPKSMTKDVQQEEQETSDSHPDTAQ